MRTATISQINQLVNPHTSPRVCVSTSIGAASIPYCSSAGYFFLRYDHASWVILLVFSVCLLAATKWCTVVTLSSPLHPPDKAAGDDAPDNHEGCSERDLNHCIVFGLPKRCSLWCYGRVDQGREQGTEGSPTSQMRRVTGVEREISVVDMCFCSGEGI